MFQFSGLSTLSTVLQTVGLPHSDICGSSGRLHLPAAFRSLPRPSSSSIAKASPMRPYCASISCVAATVRFNAGLFSARHLPRVASTLLFILPSLVKDLSRSVHLSSSSCLCAISRTGANCPKALRFANNPVSNQLRPLLGVVVVLEHIRT